MAREVATEVATARCQEGRSANAHCWYGVQESAYQQPISVNLGVRPLATPAGLVGRKTTKHEHGLRYKDGTLEQQWQTRHCGRWAPARRKAFSMASESSLFLAATNPESCQVSAHRAPTLWRATTAGRNQGSAEDCSSADESKR